jgi:glycosyltransferase involved in cell wall biosynthesis
MKVAYLITGSGDSFYCPNCHRDRLYVSSIKEEEGIDIMAIPLYLPPIGADFESEIESPVFFGAVSMYLRERVKMFENMPAFMDKIVDSPPLLRFAAKKAGATRPEGFEETTLNMIRGNDPARLNEVHRLSRYLSEDKKPDIIHISNALIIGLASQLRSALDSKIICSLQNEDDWIEKMDEPYRSEAWKLIGEESSNVDYFVSPSEYFKNLVIEKTGIDPSKIKVVKSGLESSELDKVVHNNPNPAIGFYSRLSRQNGLDKIVDAYILLVGKEEISNLELHLCGGYTSDDKGFLKEQFKKLHDLNLDDKVKLYPGYRGINKQEFFSSIDIMSVPVSKPDAFGLYLLTANSAGVPVVQPSTGAFPEIVSMTGGGICYEPDTAEALAKSILSLLDDKVELSRLGKKGKETVLNELGTSDITSSILSVYRESLNRE